MIPTFSYSKLCKFNESRRRTQSVTGYSGAHLETGNVNSLEWSGGMEYWSGVLDWTTGVGGAA